MAALKLRLYKCRDCGRESMHTTNHTGDIYPVCKATDTQEAHEYLEDVTILTIDTSKSLVEQAGRDFHAVAQALGRMIPADNGRRVYITSRGATVENNDQLNKRKGAK